MLCSRMRDALGAEACLFNGGGVRASREYADRFTYGDLKAEVPFDNEMVVARLPGRVVREAVATSRARAPEESGGYLQLDDRAAVEEPSHLLKMLAGAPLDDAREYRVALVREMFAGMDHNETLVRFAREHPERVPLAGTGREVKVVLVDSFSRSLWEAIGGFDAVDTNHDGVVGGAEIAAAVARANHEAPSPITAELILRTLDTNRDQALTRDESGSGENDPGS
jgi:hypothetical protein